MIQKILGRIYGLFFVKRILKVIDIINGKKEFYRDYNETGKPTVIPFSLYSGIGNRIKSIASHCKYYKTKEIYLAWPANSWVRASFSEIFNLEGYVVKEINRQISYISGDIIAQKEIELGSLLFIEDNHNDDFSPQTRENIITSNKYYNEMPDYVCSLYESFFSALKPSNLVLERIKSNTPTVSNFISLHIRNNYDWENCGRAEDLDSFIKEIPKNKTIYLSCMNKKVSKYIHGNYIGTVLELNNKNYKSMIDAVSDMYILAKGKEAVYSYGSTFSEISWWLSGCKQKVKVVGSQDKWMQQ